MRLFCYLTGLISLIVLSVHAQTQGGPARPLVSKNLEHLYSIDGKFFSGSTPHDERGFEELKQLGVRTIISVDGSRPDAETAWKYGMRYIHLPIGYDGATSSNAARILKAGEIADGGLYVHCHHGIHRGPAALAVICKGTGLWNNAEARAWLKQAGTSTDYPGLFKMVEDFKKPGPEEYSRISSSFPEKAEVSGIVAAMVEIDHLWDYLKEAQKADFKAPPGHPDTDPARESVLLVEACRELRRSKEAGRLGEDFMKRLEAAETEAAQLHSFLKEGSVDKIRGDEIFRKIGESCKSCHAKYRN